MGYDRELGTDAWSDEVHSPTLGARMAAENQTEKALAPIRTLRDMLERAKPEFLRALPAHLDVDRLIRVVMTVVQRTPALLKCTPRSVVGAVMEAAQLGLEPDGVLGHAYLVPYGTTCQLIIGYKGLVQLARNSGEVAHISAHVVYANDTFDFEYGSVERLTHKPTLKNRGEPIAAYAIAHLKDGSPPPFEVMPVEDINRIRDSVAGSRGASSPWQTDWSEMARKTPVRRLAKFLPLAVEAQRIMAKDELAERGIGVYTEPVVDHEPVPLLLHEEPEAPAPVDVTQPLADSRKKCEHCGSENPNVMPHRRGCVTLKSTTVGADAPEPGSAG